MIKGLLFDLNGTLIDILTNEGDENVYRIISNFLAYNEIYIPQEELKTLYFETNRQQRRSSPEKFAEFDVVALFYDLLARYPGRGWHEKNKAKRIAFCVTLAQIYRAATLFRLELYPNVTDVLESLQDHYRIAAVSDGQSAWAVSEMKALGLERFFKNIIVSGDYGFRKPDPRMYQMGIEALDLPPDEILFVGNDMYRDVYGAECAGMKTVFFRSNQGEQEYRGTNADYIIYRFSELVDAISFLNQK